MIIINKQSNELTILDDYSKSHPNIEKIRNDIFVAKKIKLHPNIQGFNSPGSFGVYKSNGGDALGVVGKSYNPANMELILAGFLKALEVTELDINKVKYNEFLGGRKVSLSIPLPTKKLERSPMKGDIVERKVQVVTGFDGKTSSQTVASILRCWCDNGSTTWESASSLKYKNTKGNDIKILSMAASIEHSVKSSNFELQTLDNMFDVELTTDMKNAFIKKVTGYDMKEYNEMKTGRRNILDAINQSIGIELSNTGNNLFGLYNGITRYTTHNMAKGDLDKMFFSNTITKYNTNAMKMSRELIAAN